MFARSISRRWFINTVGAVLVILVVFVSALSFMVQSSTYNGIESTLRGRMDELLNWLSSRSLDYQTSEFTAVTRDYIETFQDKAKMEIMALNRDGRVFITSTGFGPDYEQPMPDYHMALASPDGSGKWVGELNTGEKVMAITRVVRNERSEERRVGKEC